MIRLTGIQAVNILNKQRNRNSPTSPRKYSSPLLFRVFEKLALALKNRSAQKIFTVLKYFLSSRIFEQLALALKFFKTGGRPPSPTPASMTLLSFKCKAIRNLRKVYMDAVETVILQLLSWLVPILYESAGCVFYAISLNQQH